MTSLLTKHPQNFVRILPVVFSFCHQDAVTAVLMPEYSPFFNVLAMMWWGAPGTSIRDFLGMQTEWHTQLRLSS
jgi:hypothetical protein